MSEKDRYSQNNPEVSAEHDIYGEPVEYEEPVDDSAVRFENEQSGQDKPSPEAQTNMENLAGNVVNTVSGAFGEAQNAVAGGISAVREVRSAAKAHAHARNKMKEMQSVLTSDQGQLEHRIYVHENYDSIVAEQQAIINETSAEMKRQKDLVESLTKTCSELQSKLEALIAEDEQELRPYRNLSETAKGRLDDVSRTVAEAKRAIKAAESQVKDATEHRDQSLASAQRALSNSQERQHKLQEELAELKEDPAANNGAITRIQNDLASEKLRESEAQKSLETITTQAKSTIEIAQTHLWTQKKSLEVAQSATDTAHAEYEQRKNEFEKRQTEAHARERIAQNNITETQNNIKQAQDAFDAAAEKYDAAQAILEDAQAIQTSPEETERLKNSVSSQLSAVEQTQGEVEKLAYEEKTLRVRTRKQRLLLLAIVLGFVALVVLLVWKILAG